MSTYRALPLLLLASCGVDIPHAVLTIEDPEAVATSAVNVGVGVSLASLEKRGLDGRRFPVTVALSSERRGYSGDIWVEAYDAAGAIIGRGHALAEIDLERPSTVIVRLSRPCEADADCDDGVYCNGAETCAARVCTHARPPCETGAFACVTSTCVEAARTCNITLDHASCAPIVRPDGTETPTYCDPVSGCAPGIACQADPDCQDGFVCNGAERCVAGRCIGGLPPDVSDDNECNLDACIEPTGAAHFEDSSTNGRYCALAAGDGICFEGGCLTSACGDGLVDRRSEDCEDGNDNPNDACHACRATVWSASIIVGLGEGGGDPLQRGFSVPQGVAVDRLGNVFVADTFNNRVQRIDAMTGIATVLAGTGSFGYSGDLGPASAAQLGGVFGVALDGFGNVFIADSGNQVIRRVDAQTGIITTVAGGGTVDPEEGFDVTALDVYLDLPASVAVDGLGNLYVADQGRDRVVRIDAETLEVEVVVYSGEVLGPRGLCADVLGNVYVTDTGQNQLLIIEDGFWDWYAGTGGEGSEGDGGPAIEATLDSPVSCAVNAAGDVFIGEEQGRRIRRVDAQSGIISTYGGNGVLGFTGDGGPAVEASLNPSGLAIGPGGDLYLADGTSRRIRVIDGSTGLIDTIAGNGTANASLFGNAATALGFLSIPGGIAQDAQGRYVFSDIGSSRVYRIDPATGAIALVAGNGSTTSSGDGGPADQAGMTPGLLAADAAGNLFIADVRRVRRVDAATGAIATVAGNGTAGTCGNGTSATGACLRSVDGLALLAGSLFVSDRAANAVSRVDLTSGTITRVAGGGTSDPGEGGPATSAVLRSPRAIAVDASGALYIPEEAAARVRKVSGGVITTVATGALVEPLAVAAGAGGDLFIADASDQRVRRVSAGGAVTTVAGTGVEGLAGDGGPATSALLARPESLFLDARGDLLIIHGGTFSGAIRHVALDSGRITTLAGAVDPGGDGRVERSSLASPAALVAVERTPGARSWIFADGGSGRVRELDEARGVLRTIAGYPSGDTRDGVEARYSRLLQDAAGIAFDPTDRALYVSERAGHVIRRIELGVDPPAIRTFAGETGTARHADGPASAARFFAPAGLALDATRRTLYVADSENHVVRAIDLDDPTHPVTTVAGTPGVRGFEGDGGPARDALLDTPAAVLAAPGGGLYLADARNHRVRRVDAAGTITTVLGDGTPASSGSGAPARRYSVQSPAGLALDSFGDLFITSPDTIRRVTAGPDGIATGDDEVSTIYGAPPRTAFPDAVTHCLTGIAIVEGRSGPGSTELEVLDACQGYSMRLVRR